MISFRAWVVSVALLWVSVRGAQAGEFQQPELVKATEVKAPVGAATPKQDHVVVEFTISAEAEVQDIAIIESAGEAWDEAVRQALKTWLFKAAKHEGVVAASRTQLSVRLPRALFDAGVMSPFDAGASTPVPVTQEDAGVDVIDDVDAGHPTHEMSTTVTARTQPKSRGPSDQYIEIGELKSVPRPSAGEYLKLAPGILLTNEGGEGHPDRIFLRGFDAREGQDLELSVDGVPVNDSGNLHGNGYADLNFVIPELVENLRVIEGPFDPRQGNYAVAGSADYELGLAKRGLTAKLGVGTFNSQRLVFLWGPPRESNHTFAGAQVQRTDGFGQNRSAQSARLMAQYEGTTSDSTTFRVAATGSAAQFRMAGVVRDDDFQAGRMGFFDTYDDRQGGESVRVSLTGEVHHHREGFTNHHQAFVTYRGSRLLENFTGFLYDVQKAQQSPHGQRGDLLDRSVMAVTVGARGYGRLRGKVFNRAQELELGYFARFDVTGGQQQRILAGPQSNTPYAKDADLLSRLTDIGLYADANLSPVWWLALRGGVRTDVFTYSIDNNCAVSDVRRPSQTNPPGDASCLSQRDFGLYREPTERVSTAGAAVMPRVTAVVGPFNGVSISGAFGDGVRSVDPQYVTENRATPFASIRAWEGGVTYADKFRDKTLDVSARAVVFGTHVDKDLIFSEQAGRNIIGGGTTRLGGLVQGRVRGSFFDVAAHGTYVSSRFDDTGLLVPYVPDLVVRGDAALFHSLGLAPLGTPLQGTLGVGLTYVGRRALPFGQRSDVIFTTDVNAEVSWRFVTVGLSATNLFNAQYRLAEFNFASDFRLTGPSPTLVPTRHFTAGAPRQVFVTVSFNIGGEP